MSTLQLVVAFGCVSLFQEMEDLLMKIGSDEKLVFDAHISEQGFHASIDLDMEAENLRKITDDSS